MTEADEGADVLASAETPSPSAPVAASPGTAPSAPNEPGRTRTMPLGSAPTVPMPALAASSVQPSAPRTKSVPPPAGSAASSATSSAGGAVSAVREAFRNVSPVPLGLKDKVRAFMSRHGKKLWWLHSVYALGLGTGVVLFAQKGFDQARFLAVSASGAWLLVMLFFRLHGSGKAQAPIEGAETKTKLRFYAMTYALKNLYQGMLFFLLPFYWKSSTLESKNGWFIALLGACALLSTLDVVFDRVLLKWKVLASVFHGVALFGCMNLIVPALFPNTRTLYSLMIAAGVTTLAFWTMHLDLSAYKKKGVLLAIGLSAGLAVLLVYEGRTAIPPVPMHLSRASVGPQTLADGRLAMEVKTLHPSVIQQLQAVTDVVVPGGRGDRLRHVWRHDGAEVVRANEETSRVDGPEGSVRLRSRLSGDNLPAKLVGTWSVDVETEDGQLVGRTVFQVAE